ncbi:MAG: RNA methyltransferase [Waddliaceae bacterium]
MAKTIVSLHHPIVKHLVKLRTSSRYRHERRSVVILGSRMVNEVCPYRETRALLLAEGASVPPQIKPEEVYFVTEGILKKISGVQHPQGMLAEVAMPSPSQLDKCRYVVAFDRIGDPGNLGTLLRTALALEWEGAYILDSSCDPYNDKAIRAAKGATFYLPIRRGTWKELKQLVEENRLTPIAADIHGQKIQQMAMPKRVLLVLGSEAHGLSAEGEQLCRKVAIPTAGLMTSLNVAVAGGIFMYYIKSKLGL